MGLILRTALHNRASLAVAEANTSRSLLYPATPQDPLKDLKMAIALDGEKPIITSVCSYTFTNTEGQPVTTQIYYSQELNPSSLADVIERICLRTLVDLALFQNITAGQVKIPLGDEQALSPEVQIEALSSKKIKLTKRWFQDRMLNVLDVRFDDGTKPLSCQDRSLTVAVFVDRGYVRKRAQLFANKIVKALSKHEAQDDFASTDALPAQALQAARSCTRE